MSLPSAEILGCQQSDALGVVSVGQGRIEPVPGIGMAHDGAGPDRLVIPGGTIGRCERDALVLPVDEVVADRMADLCLSVPIFRVSDRGRNAQVEHVERFARLMRREPEVPHQMITGKVAHSPLLHCEAARVRRESGGRPQEPPSRVSAMDDQRPDDDDLARATFD